MIVSSHWALQGLSLQAPHLIYQQFFDNNLLFDNPSFQEIHSLKSILDTFFEASGTTINLEKSHISFLNTDVTTQLNIDKKFSFLASYLPSKYVGSPMLDYVVKHSSWREI